MHRFISSLLEKALGFQHRSGRPAGPRYHHGIMIADRRRKINELRGKEAAMGQAGAKTRTPE
jgi:hypothetical protein